MILHARRLLALALGAAAATTAQSADWTFEPEVTVAGTYTDNFALAPDGLEESDFVTEARPSFSLEGEGNRFNADIDYQYQHFFFAENSDRDESYHNLSAVTNTGVIVDRLNLALNGAYGQTIIDPREPIPVSNVLVTGNLTDFWSADAQPTYTQPIGERHRAQASYSYGVVRYPDFDLSEGNNVDSVDRQRYFVEFGTNPDEPGFEWSALARRIQADYEDFDTFKTDEVGVRVGVPLGRTLRLILRGGMESDVEEDPRGGGLDEEFWEAGAAWQPSARNRIEARVGERFFGTTYFAQWEMDGARLDANVTYQEAPTTLSIEQLNPQRILVRNGSNPGFDIIALTNDVYVNKEGTAQLSWALARSEIVLTARDVRREYINTQEQDRESGAGLAWYWRLGARTQINAGAYAGRVEFRGTDVTDELTQATLGAVRRLGERTLLGISLRYDQRRSNTVQQDNEYTEQAAMLTFTRVFGRNQVAFGGRNNMPNLRT